MTESTIRVTEIELTDQQREALTCKNVEYIPGCDTCNDTQTVKSGSWGKTIKCPVCTNPAYVTVKRGHTEVVKHPWFEKPITLEYPKDAFSEHMTGSWDGSRDMKLYAAYFITMAAALAGLGFATWLMSWIFASYWAGLAFGAGVILLVWLSPKNGFGPR